MKLFFLLCSHISCDPNCAICVVILGSNISHFPLGMNRISKVELIIFLLY